MSLLDQLRRRINDGDSEQTLMERLEEIRQKAIENDLGSTGHFSATELEGTEGIEVVELEVDDDTMTKFMAEALLSGSSLNNVNPPKPEVDDGTGSNPYERVEKVDPWGTLNSKDRQSMRPVPKKVK